MRGSVQFWLPPGLNSHADNPSGVLGLPSNMTQQMVCYTGAPGKSKVKAALNTFANKTDQWVTVCSCGKMVKGDVIRKIHISALPFGSQLLLKTPQVLKITHPAVLWQ